MRQTTVVFGPPGTGKTEWLRRQLELAAVKYDPAGIFACSFTRGAATELRARCTAIPRENVGTIHSICYQRMDRPRIVEVDKDLVDEWNDRYAGRYRLSGGSRDLDEPMQATDEGLHRWNVDRSTMQGPTDEHFAILWERFKQEHDAVDFTDLLIRAPESIGAEVLVVDEAQDLTPLQFQVVRRWSEDASMFVVVGDEDQLLYQWIGARADEMLGEYDHEIILHKSWRLPAAVHRYACEWIERIRGERKDKQFTSRPDEGHVEYARHLIGGQPRLLVDAIEADAAAGYTVMLLGSCGYMIAPAIRELRSRGLPYHNPYRRRRGDWNPLGRGTTARRLASFATLAERPELITRASLWQDVAALIKADGNLRRGCKKKLIEREEKYISTAELSNILELDAMAAILDGDWRWLMANVTPEQSRRIEYPMAIIERRGMAALSADPKIIVGTIHSVKGGEADVVYLLPDYSKAASDYAMTVYPGGMDAITRMFYVGLTRARRKLVLCGESGRHHTNW